MSSSPSCRGDGYLSFLEKQLERANRAFQESAQHKELIHTLSERLDLLELAQQDQARKWGLFVGDISAGRGLIQEQEHQTLKRSVEELMVRLQEIEQQRWGARDTQQVGEYEAAAAAERDQRIMTIIDNQGKDIAMDFSQLDKKV